MHFNVIGWNFRNTPLEIRDKLTLSPEKQIELGHQLKHKFKLGGIVILSTCNRTEFFLVDAEKNIDKIISSLENFWRINELRDSLYTINDLEGFRHLFRVASSLDSMVLGEPQILGQLKDTFQNFYEADLTGKLLHPLFTRAFSTAKKVRTETTIASNAVSISFAAVELAKQIFEDLSKQRVLIVGAGEMSELALKHLIKCGVSELIVTNRTFSSAAKLAEKYKGIAVPFEQINSYLHEADIVISSTGARKYIFFHDEVKKCLRKRKGKSMFFIDIAVPRDIDPEINKLHGVFCYDIDDLQSIVSNNREGREKESIKANDIIENELTELELWFKSLSVVPTIRSIREQFHTFAEIELEKTLLRLKNLPQSDRREIELLIHRLVRKLLHSPSRNLKNLANAEDANIYLESITKIFGLNPPPINLERVEKNRSRLKIS